jgi:GT2 family glycosyltransferase
MEKTQKLRPLEIQPFSRSPVDILIPFHAQYEKVTQLLKSILISVKSNPYQVTLIDDCSENKNFGEEIKKQFLKTTPEGYKPQVQYIRSEKHLGFGGALKLGFESTNLPWVLIMHSDCLVEDPNFMLKMGQSLLNWKKQGIPVKMVSACSDNPGDCELAKFEKNKSIEEDIVLKETTLPLFCAMCHRDLFGYIGGFIKNYPYAWYEDEELSFRMRKKGLLQGISTKTWIKHYGGCTIKYILEQNPDAIKTMEKNRDRCIADMKMISGRK